MAYLVRGDTFGEDALLTGLTRNATVSMKTAGKLMRLASKDFTEVLKPPVVDWVTPGQASILVRQGAVVVDVRLPEEFAERAAKGALNIPLYMLREQGAAELLDPNDPSSEAAIMHDDTLVSAAPAGEDYLALAEATLTRPAVGGYVTEGKQGIHSEHLGFVLAEMQSLARAHPHGVW